MFLDANIVFHLFNKTNVNTFYFLQSSRFWRLLVHLLLGSAARKLPLLLGQILTFLEEKLLEADTLDRQGAFFGRESE